MLENKSQFIEERQLFYRFLSFHSPYQGQKYKQITVLQRKLKFDNNNRVLNKVSQNPHNRNSFNINIKFSQKHVISAQKMFDLNQIEQSNNNSFQTFLNITKQLKFNQTNQNIKQQNQLEHTQYEALISNNANLSEQNNSLHIINSERHRQATYLQKTCLLKLTEIKKKFLQKLSRMIYLSLILNLIQLIIIPTTSINIVGPLTTKYYEPPFIQAGYHQYVPTTTLINATSSNDTYTLNFQRVQLSSNRNRVITALRDFDIILQAADIYIHTYLTSSPNNYYTTTFNILIYLWANPNITVIRIKISYLIVAQKLSLQQDLIVSQQFSTAGNPNSPCIGSPLVTLCIFQYNLLNPLPSTSYRIICSAFLNYFVHPNNATQPGFALDPRIINSTTFAIDLRAKYAIVNVVNFLVLFIRQALFDSTQRHQLMFSLQTNQLNTTIGANINFTHMVSDINVFINFRGFGGNPVNFNVLQNSPVNSYIRGFTVPGDDIFFTVLAFYGYTNICPDYYMQWTCQLCPSGCAQCTVYPSFYCKYCETNFIAAGNMSCVCSSPFSLVSRICDLFSVGCISAQRLVNGTVKCIFCNILQKMTLNSNNSCNCKVGYQTGVINICQQICGDGLLFDLECDDGNILSNDGCSSICTIEDGFNFDISTSPPTLKSQYLLQYEIKQILKDQFTNSAQIKLQHKNLFKFPYAVLKQNFQPQSSYLNFKIILSLSPYKQTIVPIRDIQITSDNQIYLQFDYDFTVETFSAQLTLNYEKTRYKNDTQNLQFILKGTNKPLKYQSDIETFKTLGQGLMIGSILNILCLLIGLLSPKFIGLESILTLQLIYYSQLLISKVSQWPSGFIFLKYLKISAGYNDIFEFTEYFLLDDLSNKMQNLFIKKLVIQNFNINFILIFLCSISLCVITWLRTIKQKFVTNKIKQKLQEIRKNRQISWLNEKQQLQKLKILNKLNEAFFWIGSQIIFWMFLPLICSIGSYFLIPNSSVNYSALNSTYQLLIQFEGVILFVSMFFIFAIGSNNFFNFWISLSSYNKVLERTEQIKYKSCLFIYLLIQGILIFFFNQLQIGFLSCSTLVLLIHMIYILLLIKINPYKQSLRIHTLCLMVNQVIYLVFLVVINLINLINNISSLIIQILGYFITFCCAVSIILTIVRLYYELRYGPALQEQIQEQRQREEQRQRQRNQFLLNKSKQLLEEDAKLRISQLEKQRRKNTYLIENQMDEIKKVDLLNWLQSRNLDQKSKQVYYFKEFTQKPVSWLKQNDKQKYEQKVKSIQVEIQKQRINRDEKQSSSQYRQVVERLKRQLKLIKKSKQ